MPRVLLYALLLVSSPAVQGQYPVAAAQTHPQASPSAPPGNGTQQPSPQPTHQDMSEANSRIQRSIEDLLHGDQVLSGADIEVAVDDYSITLTGHVDSYAQHQRVMALLEQYSRYRKIVDKLQTK